MKRIALSVFVLAVAYAAGIAQEIRIAYDTPVRSAVPWSWQESPISAEGELLDDQSEIDRSIRAVDRALSKYPANFVALWVNTIYVFKNISFYGYIYGSTSFEDSIYLANRGLEAGYTDTFLQESVHHEIASILFGAYKNIFPLKAWIATLPGGFEYGNGGVESLRQGTAGVVQDSGLFENGFLNEFAMSGYYEDFKQYCRYLFLDESKLFDLAGNYPRVAKKLNLVMSFLRQIDERFDDLYFENLRQ